MPNILHNNDSSGWDVQCCSPTSVGGGVLADVCAREEADEWEMARWWQAASANPTAKLDSKGEHGPWADPAVDPILPFMHSSTESE